MIDIRGPSMLQNPGKMLTRSGEKGWAASKALENR